MTMQAKIVNCGNRTGDILIVKTVSVRDKTEKLLATLGRGQSCKFSPSDQESIVLVSTHAAADDDTDRFVGEPIVQVTDPPQTALIDVSRIRHLLPEKKKD